MENCTIIMTDLNYKLTGLGIENFRIFKTAQFFNIKPLTILTGTNSAGKSTVGKALLLLKNSYEKRNLNELVLNSSAVNLGSAEQINPYGSELINPKFILVVEDEYSNEYKLKLSYNKDRLEEFEYHINNALLAKATIKVDDDFNSLKYKNSYFHYFEDIINENIDEEIFKDDLALVPEIKAEILNFLRTDDRIHNQPPSKFIFYSAKNNLFVDFINTSKSQAITLGEITDFIDEENWHMNPEFFLRDVFSDDLKNKIINKSIIDLNINVFINKKIEYPVDYSVDFLNVFQTINNNVLEYNINDLVISRSKYPNIYDSINSMKFEVNFVESQVETLQGILYYWIVEKLKLVKPSSDFYKGEARARNKIKDFIKVTKGEDWGELLKISVLADNQWVTLSSLGYGTSNIILKILQLIHHNNVLIVDEPEVNLHPSLQSKLADLIVLSTELKNHKINLNPYSMFNNNYVDTTNIVKPHINLEGSVKIIETHSEYFIRRLQYLVANENSPLTSDDIQLYYFNNPLEEDFDQSQQIIDIKIKENGSLSENFGPGFLDEADKIALDLYLLQYQ